MSTENTVSVRYPEIDLLRTIAIVGMIIYHVFFMGWYLNNWSVNPLSPEWRFFARTTSNTFLALVGISFILASQRKHTKGEVWLRAAKRSTTVLGAACIVSITTFLAEPNTFIRFGILHCIGASMLILPLFRKLREGNILLGILTVIVGFQIYLTPTSSSLLLPFGLIPPNFKTLDYFPLLPWFGVVLIGAGMGSLLYERLKLQPLLREETWKIWTIPGRYSLWIYLLHPVVIYGILLVVR